MADDADLPALPRGFQHARHNPPAMRALGAAA